MALLNITTETCYFLADIHLEHTGYIYALEILTCVLNAVLPLVAVTANVLVIYVICFTSALHTPPNVFLCCLAASNFLLASVAQPSFVVYKISEIGGSETMECRGRIVHWFMGFTCSGVSVLTVTAIAVERYLALHLHLKYPTTVTVRRCCIIIVCFWAFCLMAALSLFFIDSDRYWTIIPLPVIIFAMVLTTLVYANIFRILRRHQNQIIQAQTSQAWTSTAEAPVINVLKNKKTALTMLYILVLFLVCYVPVFLAMVVRLITGYTRSVKLAYELAATGFYLSATINPVFYCWRIKEVREAVLTTTRNIKNKEIRFLLTTSEQEHAVRYGELRRRSPAQYRCTSDPTPAGRQLPAQRHKLKTKIPGE